MLNKKCNVRNIEARSLNHCCRGKARSITYSEWVFVVLVIQHTKRILPVILSSVACSALPHFTILYQNGKILGIMLSITKCVFWFCMKRLSETFLILRRTGRDMIIKVYWSSYKVPVTLLGFCIKLEFQWQFFERHSNIKFNANPSTGSRVVLCGQTDRQSY
jgi:hypothetical protein